MTDSHTPQPTPASSHRSYEGYDPELPEHDKESGTTAKVSTIQVGASAAAAVTSALAASFFGVAGTLIGAAVGSIVSTVAGALYADYLRRASTAVRTTTTVMVQRIPADRLATSPLRKLAEPTDAADPAAVPATEMLSRVDVSEGDETVVVPVSSATQILATPDADPTAVVLDGSAIGPRTTGPRTTEPIRPLIVDDARPPLTPDTEPGRKSWWRRPVVALVAVSLASFAIALGVITATEGVLGHPVSGGTGGTSLSDLGSKSSTSQTPKPTTTVTVTSTSTATPTTSATTQPSASASATASTQPSATATTTPEATATEAPSVTAAPSATADSNTGALGVQPTKQSGQ